ncbi:GNAT family N-acetyltransferase [Microbacterium rhizophilus]|uniref:GNAT family N-acetyltransferase n=1 Tax=Microbacterium rhizophilus TaxID=3138934 RepID=UPI0031EA30F3
MSDAPFRIRPVADADRPRWAALFRAYRDFYALPPDDAVVDTVWGWLRDEAHELHGLVAERDGMLAGIAHWRRFARPSRGGTAVFLDDLFTAPEARGGGIGRALIGRLQEIAAGEGLLEVRWITSETNTDARRLYDRVAERSPFLTYIAPPA